MMITNRFQSLINGSLTPVLVVTGLLLSACGGGGNTTNTAPTNIAVVNEITEKTTQATKAAAVAEPIYGSVVQIAGESPTSSAEVTRSATGEYLIKLPSTISTGISINSSEDLYYTGATGRILNNKIINSSALYKENGEEATLVGFYEGDFDSLGNWVAGGYWLHGANLSSEQPSFEAGAFIDGPEISGDPVLPTGGSANYSGSSAGLYSAIIGSESATVQAGTKVLGEYGGTFESTANFRSGGGTLSGVVTVTDSEEYIIYNNSIDINRNGLVGIKLSWDNVTFTSNGQATGDVTVSLPASFSQLTLIENSGKTGNRFSKETVSDSNLNPRLLVGTHGAHVRSDGGTEAAMIGVHIGSTGN